MALSYEAYRMHTFLLQSLKDTNKYLEEGKIDKAFLKGYRAATISHLKLFHLAYREEAAHLDQTLYTEDV